MTTKNTYNPEDIESLLMTKIYDDLLPAEKEFVIQHLDSKAEYTLLRTTLLAIKKSSENDELIEANPKTKEELLLLMQSKNRIGAGWFNLNGLWSFLFPSDVFFVKKPGFQLASFAMLLIFGFYFSGQFLNLESNNLAINKPSTKVNETIINQEPVVVKEKGKDNTALNNITELKEEVIQDKSEDSKFIDRLSNDDVVIEEQDEYEDISQNFDLPQDLSNTGSFADEDVESIEEEVAIKVTPSEPAQEGEIMSNISSTSTGFVSDNEMLDDFSDEVISEKSSPSTISTKSRATSLEGVSISSNKDKISVGDSNREQKSLQSQSLADDQAIIDLFYVTL